MLGKIDRDESEEKKSNSHRYGKKWPSYRKGYKAGKRDGRKKEDMDRAKNPYKLTAEMWTILKKRARWFAGYDMGWFRGSQSKKKKKKRQ